MFIWSTCAAWFDYDNDGRLDLFVGNYVQWSKEIDLKVGFKIDGKKHVFESKNIDMTGQAQIDFKAIDFGTCQIDDVKLWEGK